MHIARIIMSCLVLALAAGCHTPDRDDDRDTTNAKQRPTADQQFVKDATRASMFEVESSRLARDRSSDSQTRSFADRMIRDHELSNAKLSTLARADGFAVPTTQTAKYDDMLSRLRKLEGSEFDRTYHDMQVQAHDEAIRMFEKASTDLETKSLRQFAADTLSTLRSHRQHLNEF